MTANFLICFFSSSSFLLRLSPVSGRGRYFNFNTKGVISKIPLPVKLVHRKCNIM